MMDFRRHCRTLHILVIPPPFRVYQKIFGNTDAVNFYDTSFAYSVKLSGGKHPHLSVEYPPLFIPRLSASVISATSAFLASMHFGCLLLFLFFPKKTKIQIFVITPIYPSIIRHSTHSPIFAALYPSIIRHFYQLALHAFWLSVFSIFPRKHREQRKERRLSWNFHLSIDYPRLFIPGLSATPFIHRIFTTGFRTRSPATFTRLRRKTK